VDFTPLRILRNLGRTRQIVAVLLNHGFGDVVDRLGLTRTYHRWRRWLFRHPTTPTQQTTSRPERVRRVLEDLGPTFVKFGQVMSTRPDLIPRPFLRELERLQERVPPFPGAQARAIVEEEFGQSISSLFAEFSTEPIAAGSLGQVHEARLDDGTRVAVKIRRPGAVRDIERDLSLLDQLAVLLVRNFPETEVFDPVGLVGQFARSIRRELQFSREGRTMDEFRRRFANDATLVIPQVYWDRTSDAVLTIDFVDGCRINDRAGLAARGLSPEDLAKHGAKVFLKMVFELGLFHGDPHPGNLRVLPDGVIGLLDYGLVGRLEPDKRDQLVDLLAAVARGDVRSVVMVLREIGRPFRPLDENQLSADVRDFLESFYGLPLERIAIGQLLGDFVAILTTHGIRYPADLMLLIRAIVTLEGVGRDLDPGFNLARMLQPFVEARIRARYRPDEMGAKMWREAETFGRVAYRIPGHVERILDKLASDTLHVQFEHQNLERLITEVDKAGNRLVIGLVMSALIVSSAMVLRTGGDATWWVTVPAFLLSSLLGVWLIYGVFRSGRL
jgi:ubiquinone biosynthesis protein